MRRTLFLAFQWIVVIGAAVLVARMLLRTENLRPEDKAAWTQWEGFAAISYTGVGRDTETGLVGRDLLRGHLEALQAAGYTTVSTQDVLAFMREGRPLPDKALYLMFEGGRKDSLLNVHPVLYDLGLRAASFVPTGRLGEWNRFFLREGDVEKIAKNAHWSLGSLGHHSYLDVPAGPGGEARHFLTGPDWNPETRAPESAQHFEERVRADYQRSFDLLRGLTGTPPEAYCFYPANTLGVSLAPAAEAANQAEIARLFPLAFTREGSPFNSRIADPLRLTRLRVGPELTPERLLSVLDAAWPRDEAYTSATARDRADWIVERGGMVFGNGKLMLQGNEDGEAFAWLTGTDTWQDVTVDTQFQAEEGVSNIIYLMYENPDSYLRIVLGHDCVTLQERLGERMRNLARAGCFIKPGSRHSFRAVIKQNRLLTSLDGSQLLDNPLPLTTFTPRGKIAVGMHSDIPGRAAVFTDFVAAPIAEAWVACREYLGMPEALRARTANVLFVPGRENPGESELPDKLQVLSALSEGARARLLFEVPAAGGPEQAETALDALLGAAGPGSGYSGVVLRPAVETPRALVERLAGKIRAAGLAVGLMAAPAWIDGLLSEGAAPQADALLLEDGSGAEPPFLTRLYHAYPRFKVFLPTAAAGRAGSDILWRTASAR